MDGGKPKPVCDLGKIILVFPDHLFCEIYFHS